MFVNRAFEGASGGLNIAHVCEVMDDDTIGDAMQRYARLNSLVLDGSKIPCLDAEYSGYVVTHNSARIDLVQCDGQVIIS